MSVKKLRSALSEYVLLTFNLTFDLLICFGI